MGIHNSINIMDWLYNYALNLSCPNRKRLEFTENVKYIAVTSRASKLQVLKVRPGWDLNTGQLCEPLNIGKLTHAGGPGSNPGQAELWRLVILKPLKLQQCILHFWKPLMFFYMDNRGQEHSFMFSLWYVIGNTHRFTSYNHNRCVSLFQRVYEWSWLVVKLIKVS